MQVVVAARNGGLSIEGHTDGLAGIGTQVDILRNVGEAGQRRKVDIAGGGPCLTVVGGDENQELVVGNIAIGHGSAAIFGESSIEGQHGAGGLREVNRRGDEPVLAAGAVNIDLVVTGGETVAHGACIVPTGNAAQGRGHTIGVEDRGTAPAKIIGEGDVEGLGEGQCLGGAGGVAADRSSVISDIAATAVSLHSEAIGGVGIEIGDSVGGSSDTALDKSGIGHVINTVSGVILVESIDPREGDAIGGSTWRLLSPPVTVDSA